MAKASRRSARKSTVSPLDGLTASVIVERGEGCVRVDGVQADQAFAVLGELMEAMRLMATRYPELTRELQPVAGYSPLEIRDDGDEQCGRRAGFSA